MFRLQARVIVPRGLDVVVVGSGPNGLAAAIELQHAGAKVLVLEKNDTVGGGLHTAALTLPGFLHDRCSAVHPLALSSPFFRKFPLSAFGLRWSHPRVAMAHPLIDESMAMISGSVKETALSLGVDGPAYQKLMSPLVENADELFLDVLAPFRVPRAPWLMAKFGLKAVQPATRLALSTFRSERARALFAGNAAHTFRPLEHLLTSAAGLLLMTSAHQGGWPIPIGGAKRIADAMADNLRALGGEIRTGVRVEQYSDLPRAALKVFDTSPSLMAQICRDQLSSRYRSRLSRYRYGPAAFKIDYAMSAKIPWLDPVCHEAATIHLGNTLEEIAESERLAWAGSFVPKPFLLVSQASSFDDSRAPEGKHTAWVYGHVPNGSKDDYVETIEAQIERFAPGFKRSVLARCVTRPLDFEAINPNYVGGDIVGGVQDWAQLFHRPISATDPYRTPAPDIFMCSASTPPGAGVHGMGGFHAARSVLRRIGVNEPPMM